MKKIAANRNYKIMKKAGMKVYVLISNMRDVDATDIHGVYSSLEKAEIAKKKEFTPGSGTWGEIEEFVVDETEEWDREEELFMQEILANRRKREEEERSNEPSFPGNGKTEERTAKWCSTCASYFCRGCGR